MRTQIQNFLGRFRRDESGAAMVEYAVALLVVTAIGIATLTALGERAGSLAETACTEIETGGGTGGTAC